jgi:hypothetical protein
MKISDYNWMWWFILSCLLLVVCFIMQMTAHDTMHQMQDIERESIGYYSKLGLYFSILNLLVCLYLGCKPKKIN